jgi:Flp pilus assembly protein TadG
MAGRGDRGSLALELVILTPVLIMFMMFLVGLGRLVEAQGQVDGAARDAARAASIAGGASTAQQNAVLAANADLRGAASCATSPSVTFAGGTSLAPGGQVNVVVRCSVRLAGLSFIGFKPTKVVTGQASAPIDTYSVGG